MVLGTHGESMVPSPTYTTVHGTSIKDLLPPEKVQAIVQRTVKAGAEIVGLLKTGSAYYAPTAAVVEMVDSILYDQKRVLPCSTLLEGEYGISGVFCGVPIKIGKNGVEEIVELKLPDDELNALKKASESLKKLQDEADEVLKKLKK
jgi:malate dehydrogenase